MNGNKLAQSTILGFLYAIFVLWVTPVAAVERTNAVIAVHKQCASYEDLKDYYLFQSVGIDAATWGEDIPNPFSHLTDEQATYLKARHVDIKRLQKMHAVVIAGKAQGLFLNWNPNVIVVLGRGSYILNRAHPDNNAFDGAQSGICSVGPIVATEDSDVWDVISDDLIWFQVHRKLDLDVLFSGICHSTYAGSPILFTLDPEDNHFKNAQEAANLATRGVGDLQYHSVRYNRKLWIEG